MTKEYPWGKGTPKTGYDATTNDSDKTVLTCGAGKIIKLSHVEAMLVTTATVGNRALGVLIYNASNQIIAGVVTASIAASQIGTAMVGTCVATSTTATRLFGTAAVNISAFGPIPEPMILTAGMYVRVWDMAAIDPAQDDLTVAWSYVEYDA